MSQRLLALFAIALSALMLVLLLLFFPFPGPAAPAAAPVGDFADAVAGIEAIQDAETELPLYPGCASTLLEHGEKTERAFVLYHGYRNCPLQFQALAAELYERGHNVYMPRMPQMGLDRDHDEEHIALTAAEMEAYAAESADILSGLGDELSVIGFSAGGAVAAWVAQNRPEVDDVMIVSPFFGPEIIPTALARPAARLFSVLPNQMMWQDETLKDDVPNPPQVYPFNATHALAALIEFGYTTRDAAGRTPPAVDTIVVVTNDSDGAVDREAMWALAEQWEAAGLTELIAYEFPANLALDHDLIDPAHPLGDIETVYPILLQFVDETAGVGTTPLNRGEG